jgi:hypothetical protein
MVLQRTYRTPLRGPLEITARGARRRHRSAGQDTATQQFAEQAACVVRFGGPGRDHDDWSSMCRVGLLKQVSIISFVARSNGGAHALGWAPRWLHSVNLVPEKGTTLCCGRRPAVRQIVIVGAGPEACSLGSKAGYRDRLRFMDNMSQDKLAALYNAADVLALGSTREGWPNVLLEAMACGTPVVATDVGGSVEIVCHDIVGTLVRHRDPAEFALALRRILERDNNRDRIRAHARRFDWPSIAQRYFDVLKSAVISQAGTSHGRD